MNALTCIYMFCNTKRNILKYQASSLDLGSRGKISVYICFMFYALTIVYFIFLRIHLQIISVQGEKIQKWHPIVN